MSYQLTMLLWPLAGGVSGRGCLFPGAQAGGWLYGAIWEIRHGRAWLAQGPGGEKGHWTQ